MSVKRANEVSPPTSVKKIQFDSNFPRDAPPEHYYYLGNDKYLTVKDFAGDVRIHLRQYEANEEDCLSPTENGVTMSPFVWHSLRHDLGLVHLPSRQDDIFVINDCIFAKGVMIDNEPHATLQRYFVRKDFSREFIPGVCLLNDDEWRSLDEMADTIAKSILCVQFGTVFPRWVMREKVKHAPTSNETSSEDASIVLTSSLVELVKDDMVKNIGELFKCFGCEQGYSNQLGHDCMTLTRKRRLDSYGDRAVAKINLCKLASDFVQKNSQLISYMTQDFLDQINIGELINSAMDLYTADDPLEVTASYDPKFISDLLR